MIGGSSRLEVRGSLGVKGIGRIRGTRVNGGFPKPVLYSLLHTFLIDDGHSSTLTVHKIILVGAYGITHSVRIGCRGVIPQ